MLKSYRPCPTQVAKPTQAKTKKINSQSAETAAYPMTVKDLGTGRQQKQVMRFNNTKPRIQHGINALGLSNRKYRQQRVFTKLQENNWKYDVSFMELKVYVLDKSVRVQILSWSTGSSIPCIKTFEKLRMTKKIGWEVDGTDLPSDILKDPRTL